MNIYKVLNDLRKKLKNGFFGYLYRSKNHIFRPKKFFKNFGAAFGIWYYFQKKIKKPKVVPGTNTGSLGNSFKYILNILCKVFDLAIN